MSVILFDKDGVIVDTEGIYLQRYKKYLNYLGYSVSDEQIISLAGSNAKRDIRLFHQWFGEDFDEEKYHSCHDEYYRNAEPIDYNKLKMKNLNETLRKLKEDGHHLSLVSSSNMKSINYIVDLYAIRDCFDYLISGDDFHESKPNPEVYLYAKSKYDYLNEKIFVVEDSDLGIEAGKRAGLTVIAKRDDRFNYDQSKADYVIDDLMEIIDIVKNK